MRMIFCSIFEMPPYAFRWKNSSQLWMVLATGQGNPTAVLVWSANTGRFSSRPVHKPYPPSLATANQDLYQSTHRSLRVGLDPWVPNCRCACRVSHFWSHWNMLQFIVKYWLRYITINFDVLAPIMSITNRLTCPTTPWKSVSTERQWFLVLHLQ